MKKCFIAESTENWLAGMHTVNLKLGKVYFSLGYEDDELSQPIINSYEYLGRDVHGIPKKTTDSRHYFRFLGSQDELSLAEDQLDTILDLVGLMAALEEFNVGKHRLPP